MGRTPGVQGAEVFQILISISNSRNGIPVPPCLPSSIRMMVCSIIVDTSSAVTVGFGIVVTASLVTASSIIDDTFAVDADVAAVSFPKNSITGLYCGDLPAWRALVLFCVCFGGLICPHSGEGPPIAERVIF